MIQTLDQRIKDIELKKLNDVFFELIIKKFGSFNNFLLQATMKSSELLSCQKDIEKLEKIIEIAKILPYERYVTEVEREMIFMYIRKKHKKATRFILVHKQFSSCFISNVINGKVKERSKKFKELLQICSEDDVKNKQIDDLN